MLVPDVPPSAAVCQDSERDPADQLPGLSGQDQQCAGLLRPGGQIPTVHPHHPSPSPAQHPSIGHTHQYRKRQRIILFRF